MQKLEERLDPQYPAHQNFCSILESVQFKKGECCYYFFSKQEENWTCFPLLKVTQYISIKVKNHLCYHEHYHEHDDND